jgi:hypothetical protein
MHNDIYEVPKIAYLVSQFIAGLMFFMTSKPYGRGTFVSRGADPQVFYTGMPGTRDREKLDNTAIESLRLALDRYARQDAE